MPAGHRSPDGTGVVVLAGGVVSDQRAQLIEECFAALLHLLFDVELLDLVHRHVDRAFHHHLNVMLPGAASKFTKGLEFSQRCFLIAVRNQSGRGIPSYWLPNSLDSRTLWVATEKTSTRTLGYIIRCDLFWFYIYLF